MTDTCTDLMWQKETEVGTNWCGALAYCESLDFAGQDDWRLPNVRELQSIVDYQLFTPSIDPVFDAAGQSLYWSSTSVADDPDTAWGVSFAVGGVFPDNKVFNRSVRAVRSVP